MKKLFIALFTLAIALMGNYQDVKATNSNTHVPNLLINTSYVFWDDMSFTEIIPEITTSTDQLTGFQYAPGAGPSSQLSFNVSGTGLSSGINITAPANYEISALGGVDFVGTNSMNIPANNGTVSSLTLYVRLKSGLSANNYTGNISVSSMGLTTKNIALSGKVESPPSTLTLSTTTLDSFEYGYGRGPSTEKSFTLSGSNLTSGISIIVPTAYEISALSGSSFSGTNTLNIPHTNGSVNNLTLYVRLKFGLSINSYTGDISFTTNGSNTKLITLSGSVTNAPVAFISSTSSITGFNYDYGAGPSNTQSFTISGVGLTQNLILTAPTEYELSADYGTTFFNTLSYTQSGGAVSTRTVYVRLKAGLNAQNYNGNIVVSSAGGNNMNISLYGNVALPAGISTSTTSLSNFSYAAESGPSEINSFVVYGGSLTSFLIITAPQNFEISTATGALFSGSGQILLVPSNNSLPATTIFVRLKNDLEPNSYSGNITLSSSGYSTKYITLTGNVSMPSNTSIDNSFYEPRNNGMLNLSNKWLFSRNLNNYNDVPHYIAPANTARGMAVKDGKMLFIDRSNKRIVVVNGATGARETPINLASNLFTYIGKNKAGDADSTWTAGLWGFQDIKVDNAGNVLVGNFITSNTGRFQICKINMNDGTGTLVIDQSNLATLYPAATTLRLDYFNVLGDVNSNAIIMAANASTSAMEVYKWTITNGVASNPTVIELDNSLVTGKDLAGLANLGSGPQVFPVSENAFYVDGNATYPVLCDMNGNVLDGFKSNLNNLKDSVTWSGMMWTMNQGHNGMKEFQVGNEHFIVMAATNTAGSPASTFRLFKFADANKSFASMQCLWTFPQFGMGSASNAYRVAMPAVEVIGNTARIYVYIGENGYGLYELTTNGTLTESRELKTENNKVNVNYINQKLVISELVKNATIYNIAGYRIASIENNNSVDVNLPKGVYIVNIVTNSGLIQSEKVIVR